MKRWPVLIGCLGVLASLALPWVRFSLFSFVPSTAPGFLTYGGFLSVLLLPFVIYLECKPPTRQRTRAALLLLSIAITAALAVSIFMAVALEGALLWGFYVALAFYALALFDAIRAVNEYQWEASGPLPHRP